MAYPPDDTKSGEAELSVRSEILADTAAAMARLRAVGERPPCAVVLGERNSGKTSVVNALLADGLLPPSVIGNTSHFALVRYADSAAAVSVSASGVRKALNASIEIHDEELSRIEIELANARLKIFEVLDTPGDVAPAEALSLPWLPPVRIPLWCTVATQAWKESERVAWTSIDSPLRRHGVLVVTALDRIAGDRDAERLAARLLNEAAPYFKAVAYAATESDAPVSGLTDVVTAVSSLSAVITARRKLAADKLARRLESLVAG